jgi:hypothetical protein
MAVVVRGEPPRLLARTWESALAGSTAMVGAVDQALILPLIALKMTR